MRPSLNRDLIETRLRELTKETRAADEELRTKQFTPILEITKAFLVSKKVIFYGGMAQNLYLPPKERFYAPTDLPDYDVFTSRAETLARELADRLVKHGYEMVTVRYALHDGTYKVSWDFQDLVDLTQVTKRDETRMRRRATRQPDGVLLCPLDLLKANAYIELAMPKSSMFRWAKVFDRLHRLERAHPMEHKVARSKSNTKMSPFVEEAKQTLVSRHCPLIGDFATTYYLSETTECCELAEAISTDPKATCHAIVKRLQKMGAKASIKESSNDDTSLLEAYVCVIADGVCVARVYDTKGRCYSTQRGQDGILYASIFLVIRLYYHALYLTPRRISCAGLRSRLAQLISAVRAEDLSAECYGEVRSVLSIKRSKARKDMSSVFYKPRR
jgi:hypothetical protein